MRLRDLLLTQPVRVRAVLQSPPGRNMLGSGSAVYQPRNGAPDQMRKIGFKALTALLTIGRYSKKHISWTLAIAIAIFSTIVTIGLIALYVLQGRADLR